jgi:glutaredoxin 3
MEPIVVYSSHTCPNCENLKKALVVKGIQYKEVNIQDHPWEADMLREKGFRQLPVIQDNGEWMTGFTPVNFNKIMQARMSAAPVADVRPMA